MDVKKPLLITACSVGAMAQAFGATHTTPSNTTSTVSMKLPNKATQSGRVKVIDGQIYVRIGKVNKNADGSRSVMLPYKGEYTYHHACGSILQYITNTGCGHTS